MTTDEKIAALEAKVALFERVIRAFVENPFIYNSDSFYPLLTELGYERVSGEDGGRSIRRLESDK